VNSSQPIKLAVVLYLALGKHIGQMSAGLLSFWLGLSWYISVPPGNCWNTTSVMVWVAP